MNVSTIKRELNKILLQKYIDVEEYQDKYYFKKKIQELFPGLPDNKIFEAIETVNSSLKPPRKKTDFIAIFSSKIFDG